MAARVYSEFPERKITHSTMKTDRPSKGDKGSWTESNVGWWKPGGKGTYGKPTVKVSEESSY